MADDKTGSYDIFRDCLFAAVVKSLSAPGQQASTRLQHRRKGSGKAASKAIVMTAKSSGADVENDAADFADFSEYLASEAFFYLPIHFQTISYEALQQESNLSDLYSLPLTLSAIENLTSTLPPSLSDSLIAYGLIKPPSSDLQTFLSPIFTAYLNTTLTPPPKWISTRKSACEICLRSWIPLTYHHLIPKAVHAKVLRRRWHDESRLNSVAWLCRACHSFVHQMSSNEELAREWFTVERILQRDDVTRWAEWVGRVRWKKR